jgi:hypothetical protein
MNDVNSPVDVITHLPVAQMPVFCGLPVRRIRHETVDRFQGYPLGNVECAR